MNSKEIIDYLKSEASEKYKENVIKWGYQKNFALVYQHLHCGNLQKAG